MLTCIVIIDQAIRKSLLSWSGSYVASYIGMRQVPLEIDENIAINGHSWFATSTKKRAIYGNIVGPASLETNFCFEHLSTKPLLVYKCLQCQIITFRNQPVISSTNSTIRVSQIRVPSALLQFPTSPPAPRSPSPRTC